MAAPRRAAALLAVLSWFTVASATDPDWPPTPEVRSRMEQLRRTMGDPSATTGERQAAREELARLLMHPGARSGPAIAPMPPRAAVDPAAPVRPAAPSLPAAPTVTPVAPPDRAPNPIPDGRGGVVVPSGKNVVDPRTGSLLIDVGNGYLDPATGRFVPKP